MHCDKGINAPVKKMAMKKGKNKGTTKKSYKGGKK
jgi:hypothetical protein